MVRAPCARSQLLIAVPRTAGGFLSLLVQRKKPKKARPGWRNLSRYASGSAGKPRAHILVRPFALPLAALTPRLRGFGSRAAPTRHPVAAGQAQTSLSAPPSGRSPKALRGSGAPYGFGKKPWHRWPLVFSGPRSRRRASQPESGEASLVFEPEGEAEYLWKSGGLPCRRTGAPQIGAPGVHAPGELGERRFRREAQEAVGGSGVSFLLVTFLWTSKEKSPRVQGRSHPQLAVESRP